MFFLKKYFLERKYTSIGSTFTEFGGTFLPSLAESATKTIRSIPLHSIRFRRQGDVKSKYVNTSKNLVYCFLLYPFGKGSEEANKTRE